MLVVDDDRAFRALLRELLEAAGFAVVGEAADGAEGIALAAALAPGVVTMDLEMPRLDGVGATAELCRGNGCPAVVIVSGSHSSEKLGEALRAGARWHVAKRDVASQPPPVVAALLNERSS